MVLGLQPLIDTDIIHKCSNVVKHHVVVHKIESQEQEHRDGQSEVQATSQNNQHGDICDKDGQDFAEVSKEWIGFVQIC